MPSSDKRNMRNKGRQRMTFGVFLLTLLAVKLWLVGCAIIGYMAWVLATSVTVKQFVSGNLIFIYVVVGVGFLLFITGLLGWVGTSSGSACIIRMYIMAAVLAIALEVGGVLALSIMRMDMADIIEHGWSQVNQVTRNAIQQHFDCCGYTGPKEFAYRNDPIDDSCYENVTELAGMTTIADVTSSILNNDSNRTLKQHGCGRKLEDWFDNNQVIWVSIMAAIGFLEILGIIVAIHVVNRTPRSRRQSFAHEIEERGRHYED